jgi:hypothetical protein
MGQPEADLDKWLRRSTKASSVPLKVTDRAGIAALQLLVRGARRTKTVVTEAGRQGIKRG